MKYKDLVNHIEKEVKEAMKSDSAPQKPVTINIKRDDKKIKEKDLEEADFEEIMFTKLDEEEVVRKAVSKIIKETIVNQRGQDYNLDRISGSRKKASYETYHNSFSAACSEVIEFAKKRGYEINENDWFNQVSTGPRKPDPGKTNRYSIELMKENLPTKKYLHFQVYGMEGGKYELNAYIN